MTGKERLQVPSQISEKRRSAESLLAHFLKQINFPELVSSLRKNMKDLEVEDFTSDNNAEEKDTVGKALNWSSDAKRKRIEIILNSEGRAVIKGSKFWSSTSLPLWRWLDHQEDQKRAFNKAISRPQIIKKHRDAG